MSIWTDMVKYNKMKKTVTNSGYIINSTSATTNVTSGQSWFSRTITGVDAGYTTGYIECLHFTPLVSGSSHIYVTAEVVTLSNPSGISGTGRCKTYVRILDKSGNEVGKSSTNFSEYIYSGTDKLLTTCNFEAFQEYTVALYTDTPYPNNAGAWYAYKPIQCDFVYAINEGDSYFITSEVNKDE